ncbi:MAG: exodeoxyribonuclease VII small subunit [Actinomycetota bacterium]|nr:exodeoxyribonuclease VII small subunit [Actinomycetota bacterium]
MTAEGPGSAGGAAAAGSLGYEQARDELAEVVRRLEAGGVSLEESLALWERGEELAAMCRRWLDGAGERLARVTGNSAASEPPERNSADSVGDAS